jgi:hypothetical protein
MNYVKPNVTELGTAHAVIEFTGKSTGGLDPIPPRNTDPAYDLDE